jgi:hypothetical protein
MTVLVTFSEILLAIDQEGSGCQPGVLTRHLSIIFIVDAASFYLQLPVAAGSIGRCMPVLQA